MGGEWKEVSLADVTSKISDGLHGTPTYNNDGEYYFINGNNLSNGKIIIKSDTKKVSKEEYLKHKKPISENTILLSINGTIGNLAFYNNEKCILGKSACYINVNTKADKRFLYHVFCNKDFQFFINGIATGTTIPNVPLKGIKDYNFKIPPLSEQKAIATVLSSLDDKTDLLHRQNKTLETMAETLFRQWFIEEAQEDWEEKPLKEILEFVVDNRGKTVPTVEIGIPLIATNCIKNDNIFPVYEKLRYVSEDTHDNWFRSHPKPGDIIFVNKGTPGCVNLVPEPIDFCIAQDMIALRVKKTISNYYLFLYLRSSSVQYQIRSSSVGTTIPHLKKTDLINFSIPIASKEKQNHFEKMVTPCFLKMNKNYLQIRTLEKLRDNLLPKLMSGEVRVNYE